MSHELRDTWSTEHKMYRIYFYEKVCYQLWASLVVI